MTGQNQALILPKPAAILFDWDNTLVDTWPLIHRSFNITQQALGHALWSLDEVKQNARHSMRDAFPMLFGERAEEAGEIYQQSYRDIHLKELQPYTGSEETLKLIKQAGIYCGAVSNKKGPSLRKEVAHLGWNQYFEKAIGSGDAKQDKPAADPAIMALEGSEIQANTDTVIWFVGDTSVDLQCAENLGAKAVLYGAHETADNQHEGHQFDAHASDQSALQALLEASLSHAKV